jgi:hypothetical protein
MIRDENPYHFYFPLPAKEYKRQILFALAVFSKAREKAIEGRRRIFLTEIGEKCDGYRNFMSKKRSLYLLFILPLLLPGFKSHAADIAGDFQIKMHILQQLWQLLPVGAVVFRLVFAQSLIES